jgi:hypothetical protein
MLKWFLATTKILVVIILLIVMSIPSYGLIKPQIQGSNHQRINPMEIALFEIEIENKGIFPDGRIIVYLDVESESVPEGWIARVTDQIIIDNGSIGFAYLTVKPPKSFGYHDETCSVTVEIIHGPANNPSEKYPPYRISVLVESRGFSIYGIEIILLIIISIIILGSGYFIYKRKNKKERV